MWTLGTKIDPQRPPCRCLVALPGLINTQTPLYLNLIEYAQWPHWSLWGYVLVGIDPVEEVALVAWQQAHPDG